MPYNIRIHPRVINLIRSWHLPDKIQEEVALFFREVLPQDTESYLSRENSPYNGMVCRFSRRDHHIKGWEHEFAFHVYISQDEMSLLIENGITSRTARGAILSQTHTNKKSAASMRHRPLRFSSQNKPDAWR